MVPETAVTIYLDDQGVSYTLVRHNAPALTCETAAAERGCRVGQIVKTMIGRDDESVVYVMMIPGDRILKIKKVRHWVGGKPVSLIPAGDLASEFGLVVGAISPIQFLGKARLLIDPTVLNEEYVDISAGDPMLGIELTSKDLLAVTGAEVVDIISANR